MRLTRFFVVPLALLPALAVSLAATPLHAAPAPATAAPERTEEGATIETRGDTRVLIYEGDTLEGEVLSPGGASVSGHIGARHASLVGIRPHFVRELVRLSHDL